MPPGAAVRAASQQRGERYSLGSRRRGRPSDFPSDARVPDEPRNPCGGRRIWHAIWHGSRKTRCDGGTQRDEPNGVLRCFVVCCYTPQGREKPTGTGAPSYGSEGWGFESLSEGAKVLVTGLQMSV